MQPLRTIGATRLLIGSDGRPETTFDGKIDEVAVYDRALLPKELKAHFDAAGFRQIE